jgi:hypothetical protein
MPDAFEKSIPIPVATRRGRPSPAIAALSLSGAATIVLAFLTVFGVTQSCSPVNIYLFLGLFGLSAAFAFTGIIVGGIVFRRARSAVALMSLLFAAVYAALLVNLIRLMQS